MKERRGRACKASGTNKGRPPKLDHKVEEDHIAENQRLRMEIEHLKKLSALVLAEEQKNGKLKEPTEGQKKSLTTLIANV